MSHHDNPEHAEAALRLLATRLLEVDTTAVAGGDEVQLLPGQLPHDLPVEVPLPLGARLIGSLVQWYPRTTAIVLDTPSSPDAVYTFYQERLPAMGWRSWTGSKVASGFVDDTPYFWSKQYVHPRFFGRGARHADIFYRGSPPSYDDGNGRPGPVLFVHATAKPDESTEVRLWLAEDEHGVAGMG